MKKGSILLIGYNYSPETTGIGKYSGEMMQSLASRGYECSVLTSYPYYPQWEVQEPYKNDRFWYRTEREEFPSGGSITVYRCPMYVPADPSGLKRMVLDMTFLCSGGIKVLGFLFETRFDYVFSVAPSFLMGLLGTFYKKLRGTAHIYHIQDLQIEAARDFNLIESQGLLKFLFKMERFIFRNADVVTSISEPMIARIEEKTDKNVLLFPNWADTTFFHPIADKAAIKVEFGFFPTDKVVLYSGAIGEKQGLEAILFAAKALEAHSDIKFIICGSSPYKANLQQMAREMQLTNVHFFDLQPKEKFNGFLNLADLHLVLQKAKASDLVMPSKLTTILAVGGTALITANAGTGLHTVVTKYTMGILVDAEDQTALNDGILRGLDETANVIVAQNARAYAERFLALDNVMDAFETEVMAPLNKKG